MRDLPAPYTIFGVLTGRRSGRHHLTIVWKDQLKPLEAQSVFHYCLAEFSHDVTGYSRGHVYYVEKEL
jgi:hypothetical protein